MRRNQRIIICTLLTVFCSSCSGDYNERSSDVLDSFNEASNERNQERDRIIDYELRNAVVDSQAMNQLSHSFSAHDDWSIWEKYEQSEGEYNNWCEKLWGRCCSEAELRFTEKLFYAISTTHDYEVYPFENAIDEFYNTAYVFDANDSIEIHIKLKGEEAEGMIFNKTPFDMLTKNDRIHNRFNISLINGYAKSEKTFNENARIKKVQLWLNGVHKCNALLLDSPEIQLIKGTFAFHKLDKVKLVPVAYYPGTKYDDVYISAIQLSLGHSANAKLDEKYSD